MTTRGVINSNFYQIVNVDVDGNPTDIKPGYVPTSNYANYAGNAFSVDVANVVGIGNIATVNLDGNSGNVLYGNGVFSAAGTASNANSANFANYANFAGNAYSVDVGNVVGIGNIATINIDGNSGNVLYGNGVFSAVPNVANSNSANFANYANFSGNAYSVDGANVVGQVGNALISGTVYTNSQPNITSVGTLTGLTVSGAGSFGANVNMNTYWINNVGYPSANSDAATKEYVDILASTGISFHEAVNAATNTTLTIATGGTTAYVQPNGAGNGIGAYISTTGTFTTIDTENIAVANSRILVKDEANATWNGIYNYTNATAITRSSDADTYGLNNDLKLSLNDYFFTTGGNVNKGTAFIVNEPASTITFGTSNIGFAVFSTGLVYTGGTGINIVGTVINISNTTVSNGTYGNGDNVATFTVNDQGQLTAASNTVITANAGNLTGTTLNANIVNSSLTSVGTLTTLDVTGNISTSNYYIGNGAFLTGITGVYSNSNVANYLPTFTGNLSAGNANLGNLVVANYFSGNGSLLTDITANTANYANYAGNAFSVAGANVVGEVANANFAAFSNTAYSVAGANVSGIVANANYASYAGNAFSITGSNVVGEVANANYASYAGNAFSVTGSNVFGEVANANYASYAGNVTIASQSNITSVGTLTSLVVSGNITTNNITAGNLMSAQNFIATTQTTATTPGGTLNLTYLSPQNQRFTGSSIYSLVLPSPALLTDGAAWYVNNDSSNNIVVKNFSGGTLYTVLPGGNTKFIFIGGTSWDYHSFLPNTMSASSTTANLANLVVANYFSGNGSLLTGITAVSTANANYANFAGDVINSTQSNITSVGTLTSLNVTGNITGNAAIALYGNGGAMTANVSVTNYYGSTNYNLGFAQSRGTRNSPSAVTAGDTLLSFVTLAYTGNGDQTWDSVSGWKSITPWITTMVAQPISNGGYYSSNIRMVTGNATSNTLNIMSFNESGTLAVPGNITATNSNLGNLTISNYFTGTLTTAAQPNITSVGTLGNLAVTNTGNIGNINMTKFNETVVAGGSVSGTITPQAQTGTIYTYTLTGSITLNTITNAVAGTSMTILLTQGGSGSYTLTSTWKFSSGSKTLSTAVGTIDAIFVFYDGTSYYATLNKGYV